jgi:hypothetical protein
MNEYHELVEMRVEGGSDGSFSALDASDAMIAQSEDSDGPRGDVVEIGTIQIAGELQRRLRGRRQVGRDQWLLEHDQPPSD